MSGKLENPLESDASPGTAAGCDGTLATEASPANSDLCAVKCEMNIVDESIVMLTSQSKAMFIK